MRHIHRLVPCLLIMVAMGCRDGSSSVPSDASVADSDTTTALGDGLVVDVVALDGAGDGHVAEAPSPSDASSGPDVSSFEVTTIDVVIDGAGGGGDTVIPPMAPIMLGIMVHLEGWTLDTEDKYASYADYLRSLADLFEANGAKLTLESKELTDACIALGHQGDCVLAELEARGHGIGIHADLGGNHPPGYTVEQFAQGLADKKAALESLGVTVRHSSGVCSDLDWVQAMGDAGLLFVTGIVEQCVLCLDDPLIPPELAGCTNPAECHGPYPPDLVDRLHPWRAKSGPEWVVPSPQGPVVILSTIAGLTHLYEEMGPSAPLEGNEFDELDVETFEDVMDVALTVRKPTRPASFYVGLSIGTKPDSSTMEQWLQAADAYVQAGHAEWKTLPEMYDAFVAWEATLGY